MSYLQDIAANRNPKEIAKAVEDAMFAYIYSNLSQDGQAVDVCREVLVTCRHSNASTAYSSAMQRLWYVFVNGLHIS